MTPATTTPLPTPPQNTTASRIGPIGPIIAEALEVHTAIRTAIHTVYTIYTATLPLVAEDVTNDDKTRAYEAASHVVNVLRHFSTVLENLLNEGWAKTTALLAEFVVDAYSGWNTYSIQTPSLSENEDGNGVMRAKLHRISIAKYYGRVFHRVSIAVVV